MSQNWRLSEICIVINDKSQGSTAKHLRCDGLLHHKFILQFAGERILKVDEYCISVDRTGSGGAMSTGVMDELGHRASAGGRRLLGASGHVLLRAIRSRTRLRARLLLGLPIDQNVGLQDKVETTLMASRPRQDRDQTIETKMNMFGHSLIT